MLWSVASSKMDQFLCDGRSGLGYTTDKVSKEEEQFCVLNTQVRAGPYWSGEITGISPFSSECIRHPLPTITTTW